jgi:hypothetical protein
MKAVINCTIVMARRTGPGPADPTYQWIFR